MRNTEYALQDEADGYMTERRGCLQAFFPQRPTSNAIRSISSVNSTKSRSEGAFHRSDGRSVHSYDEYKVALKSRSVASSAHRNESFFTTKTSTSPDTRRTAQSNKPNILFRIRADEDKSTRSSTANESVDLEFDDDNSFSMASQMGLLNSELSCNMSSISPTHGPFDSKVAKQKRNKRNGSSTSFKKSPSAPFSSMSVPLDDLLEDDVLEDVNMPSSSVSSSTQGKFHVFKACVPTIKKKQEISKFKSPRNSSSSHFSPKVQYGSSVVVENDYTQILFQPNHQNVEFVSGIQGNHQQKGFTESAAKNWKGISPSRSEEFRSHTDPDDAFLQTLAKALSNNYDQLQADLRKLTGNTELQRLMSESKNPDVPLILDLNNIEDQSDLVSEFGMGSTSGGRYNDHASVVRAMERDHTQTMDYGPSSRRVHSFRMSPNMLHERYGAIEEQGQYSSSRPNYDQVCYERPNRRNQNRYVVSKPLGTLKEEPYVFGERGVRKTQLTLAEAFDDFVIDDVIYKEGIHPNNNYDFMLDDEKESGYIISEPEPSRSNYTPRTQEAPHDDVIIGRQHYDTRNWREERRAQILNSNSERIASTSSSVSSGSLFNRSQKYAERINILGHSR